MAEITRKANTAAEFIKAEQAKGKNPNRLIHEKSPYLLQHAFNPVDWFPWGDEPFDKARREDKPVFLSIGYSTCHWCHVMAHESFEDQQTADFLNEHFVSIKVDREERPDVDQLYMAATQALTGGGGWPMSVFLLPDRKPFYAGTYFPPVSRYGQPGFRELLQSVHRAWGQERDNLLQAADKITAHLRKTAVSEPAAALGDGILKKAYQQIGGEYDAQFGGFGRAPKFPRPVTHNFLLRYHHGTRKQKALDMVLTTLRRMAAGGMYDHVGGGFHRYSVDAQWRVPHFEKMLYDQAQLATSFLEAFQITGERFYGRIAEEVLDYVLRDMTDSRGGFYSAEDADSQEPDNPAKHGEGVFYIWKQKEIAAILGLETAAIVSYHYGIKEAGNALADPMGEFVNRNILYQAHTVEQTAGRFGKPAVEIDTLLSEARQKLFAVRAQRPRPHLDDKVITAWNGLMISAFARGAQVLNQPRYEEAARRAGDFVMNTLYDAERNVLLRRYRDGAAGLEAHLDDYAFLVQGFLDLYEAGLDFRWLQYSIDLTGRLIALFADEKAGGFFDNSAQNTGILMRMKSDYDSAEPTGNSVAALNLLRLAQMTGKQEWREMGGKTISSFAKRLEDFPIALPQMLVALDFQLGKPKQIVIAGRPKAADTRNMLRQVHKRFLPRKIILLADGGEAQKQLAGYLPFMNDVRMIDGKATAHVCENYVCKLPTTDLAEMAAGL